MNILYKGTCPICNENIFIHSDVEATVYYGYVYQGKIKRYFHLRCLDSIKRGSTNVKEEQI